MNEEVKTTQVQSTEDALQTASEISVVSHRKRVVVENIRATKNSKLGYGEEIELTDHHMELIAECILQTLYNLGIASEADIDFDIRIEGGTTYHTIAKDGDVYVRPLNGEPYLRRIRNDRNIFKSKDDFEGTSFRNGDFLQP